jgi:hypothetical protein
VVGTLGDIVSWRKAVGGWTRESGREGVAESEWGEAEERFDGGGETREGEWRLCVGNV